MECENNLQLFKIDNGDDIDISETGAGVESVINPEDLNTYAVHGTIIKDIINIGHRENAFFVCDVNAIIEKYRLWKRAMPRITPYYAVKCNNHAMVLKVLAALGSGFDCASKGEIKKILSLGVSQSRIIYAHTVKPFSHIRYAAQVNVDLITFDNENELFKLKKMYPHVRAVIRIRYDARAFCSLGTKFGCNAEAEAPILLQKARSLGINVVGVSFHVGSSCYQPSAFYGAIKTARNVFDYATTLGFNFTLLDIGGGFTSRHHQSIFKYAKYINTAIDDFFPDETIEVISEPGTYFVENAFTLACNIHSIKKMDSGSDIQMMYYVNDGVFGSFLIRLVDKDIIIPQPLKKYPRSKIYPSIIWGPTMDSVDMIVSDILLPEMDIGDWIVFPKMGDYSITVSTLFNGFEAPQIYNIINRNNLYQLSNALPFKTDDCVKRIDSDLYITL